MWNAWRLALAQGYVEFTEENDSDESIEYIRSVDTV